MNPQEIRQSIRKWKKEIGVIVSPVGEIKLDKQRGEGGTAIVFESNFAGGSAVKFLTEPVSVTNSTRYQRFLVNMLI